MKTTACNDNRIQINIQRTLNNRTRVAQEPIHFKTGPVHLKITNKDIHDSIFTNFETIEADLREDHQIPVGNNNRIERNKPIKVQAPFLRESKTIESPKKQPKQQRKAPAQNQYEYNTKYRTPQRNSKIKNFSSKASELSKGSRRTRDDR